MLQIKSLLNEIQLQFLFHNNYNIITVYFEPKI